jgi:hypothetical protein
MRQQASTEVTGKRRRAGRVVLEAGRKDSSLENKEKQSYNI